MNRQQFGKELQTQLSKGFDVVKISRWAYQVYSNNCRNIDPEVREILKYLFSMDVDPQSLLEFTMTREIAANKKSKTTVYMSEEDEDLLNEIFIKRLWNRNKTDKSSLICEGIRLLYEKEVMSANDKE
jgi:hypothetical protein